MTTGNRGEQKTSPRRLSAAARRNRAVELRVAGMTFEQIAATPTSADDPRPLYPGRDGRKRAHEAVTTAMRTLAKETNGATSTLRAMELQRLDAMQLSLWPSTRPTRRVTQPCTCGREVTMFREPDVMAVREVRGLMERRAKYLGLDASDEADGRMVALLEQQVALAQRAILEAMDRAGISPEQQREVLEHAGDILREADAVADVDG